MLNGQVYPDELCIFNVVLEEPSSIKLSSLVVCWLLDKLQFFYCPSDLLRKPYIVVEDLSIKPSRALESRSKRLKYVVDFFIGVRGVHHEFK